MQTDSNNNADVAAKAVEKSAPVVDSTLAALNQDCFLQILDYLDAYSLMHLCQVNKQFQANICAYKHIFGSKLFDINEFDDIRPILSDYGPFIRKLDANEYNLLHEKFSQKFNSFLRNIVSNLVPANLTQLTLRFRVVKLDQNVLDSALPFFVNLEHFSLFSSGLNDYSGAQEHFLDQVIGNARQLKSLDLRYLRTAGRWYRFDHLRHLQSHTFLFVELITFANFREFIQSGPMLRSLIISTESVHHQHLCRLVTKYIPNLEVFEIRNSYLQLPNGDDFDFGPEPPEAHTVEISDAETEDGDSTFDNSFDDSIELEDEDSDSDLDDMRDPEFNAASDPISNWKSVYADLSRMNHLKKTWLKSHYANCVDLYDILKAMATKNTVNYLTIQINTLEIHSNDVFLIEPFPTTFTALKTLRIVSPSKDSQRFLRHFIQSLPNVSKCILDVEIIDRSVQDTIANVLAAARCLQVLGLKMPVSNFDHLLYMKLMGIQYYKSIASPEPKQLEIYINSESARNKCLAKLNDRYDEQVIALKLKKFMLWELNPL